MRIINKQDLIMHGNNLGRRIVTEILEAGLDAANPYNNTKRLLRLVDNELIIGGKHFEPEGAPLSGCEVVDLTKVRHIYVFGAGKGIQYVAKAIEDTLGDYLTGGHVIDKKGHEKILNKIEVSFGSHPLPDEDCILGCKRIVEMARAVGEDDLVFLLTANGISSLLTLPVPGVSLDDLRKVTKVMQIERGVPTTELNTIRNHLDMLKGGRITKIFSQAKLIHILAVRPDSYESLVLHNHWLHTLPDCTTLEDAINTLDKWEAWEEMPDSVKLFLQAASDEDETPKLNDFENPFRVFGVMPDDLGMLSTAMKKAAELGITPIVLSENIQLEATHVSGVMAAIAKNIEQRKAPFKPPCALFTTGEFLVTVGKELGIGGRNQEFVLSFAPAIANSKQIVVGSVDSDGTDGPGDQLNKGHLNIPCLAGGIVDGETCNQAIKIGIDVSNELKKHNTSEVLWQVNSGIVATKNISLNDLSVILIM